MNMVSNAADAIRAEGALVSPAQGPLWAVS